MKLFTDGQHNFNVIRQRDLAKNPENQIRYQQEASKGAYCLHISPKRRFSSQILPLSIQHLRLIPLAITTLA